MQIYGKNVALEKLNSKSKINKIYLSSKFNDREILSLIEKRNISTKLLDNRELDRMCKGLHQGIILEVEDIKTYTFEEVIPNIDKEYPLIVILDHLEDPHNLGAIIRSSEAFGVDAIILPNDRSVQITSTVVKTSVGTIEKMKIVKVPNLNNTIKKLKDYGYWIVGTDMEGEDYTSIDYKTKIAIVIGNEGKGISRLVSENCDYLAKIPMKGTVNSLNASVACGIFLSEITRSRGN
ncbi:MAG: 23S rRNA (guanosine(2251)-2'-O)-methyltransferase RlmB [Bacilli bacterium]|nr:23S rRNA (guanosine(2251)-2'-O)-methyltransferase RlmB [Bacilli bacterium]